MNSGTLIWINASARGEYNETFIGDAVLTLDGTPVGSPMNVTNGNVTFNATETSRGTYDYAIRFYNTSYYYNETTNSTVLTVNVPSSGGRTSVGPSLEPETVSGSDTSVKYVMGGTPVEFDLSRGDDPVVAITFDAKDNEGLVVTKVQVIKERPSDLPAPQGSSYSIMSIDVGATGTISEDNADNLRIRFKVSKEWIEQNGIDLSTIRMERYNGGQWNALPTYQEREDDEYIYFYAETPGFSIFEVVGDKISKVSEQVPASAPVTEDETEVIVEEEEEETQGTPGFTGLLSLVFISFALLFLRRSE
ncbi:MAG: PGF-pre-PGF domain-containing protein [Methanolobus sp.]